MSGNNNKRRVKKFEKLTKEDYDFLIDQIEDLQNNSGGGDFIPLTGTEEGKPVIGDIELKSDTSNSSLSIYSGILGYTGNQISFGLSDDDNIFELINRKNDNVNIIQIGDNGVAYNTNNSESIGIYCNIDHSNAFPENKNIYAQRSYVDKANSYSTTETLTGGTWIDGKPIYTLVKLTTDPDPSYIETRLPDIIVGSYSILQYTKTID